MYLISFTNFNAPCILVPIQQATRLDISEGFNP